MVSAQHHAYFLFFRYPNDIKSVAKCNLVYNFSFLRNIACLVIGPMLMHHWGVIFYAGLENPLLNSACG